MQKYQFTGHLSPLPPGVKLPLQLSGEVYLVAEVDAKFKEYDDDNVALSRSVSNLSAQLAEKDATIVELKQWLEQEIDLHPSQYPDFTGGYCSALDDVLKKFNALMGT